MDVAILGMVVNAQDVFTAGLFALSTFAGLRYDFN